MAGEILQSIFFSVITPASMRPSTMAGEIRGRQWPLTRRSPRSFNEARAQWPGKSDRATLILP